MCKPCKLNRHPRFCRLVAVALMPGETMILTFKQHQPKSQTPESGT